MRTKSLRALIGVFIVLVSIQAVGQSDTDSLDLFLNGTPTVLFGITGVDDLDSDSTEHEAWSGGGLELIRAFSTKHYPNLRPCASEVRKAVLDWKDTVKLVLAYDNLSTNTVTFRLWPPDRQGLFEINYLCKADGTYARSWMNFYTLSGERIEVEAVSNLYETYQISTLWDELSRSMGCFAD